MKSRNNSLQKELMKSSVLEAIALFRKGGMKTEAALKHLSEMSGISQRRLYSIAFDQPIAVRSTESWLLALGKIKAQRWLAAYFRRQADFCDALANVDEAIIRESSKWAKSLENGQAKVV